MFPRRRRVARAAFARVAGGPHRITTAHFLLTPSREATGYAVVVSKQVARLSVARHRLKRRITAVLERSKLPPGLVVSARRGAALLPFTDIESELQAGLARIA